MKTSTKNNFLEFAPKNHPNANDWAARMIDVVNDHIRNRQNDYSLYRDISEQKSKLEGINTACKKFMTSLNTIDRVGFRRNTNKVFDKKTAQLITTEAYSIGYTDNVRGFDFIYQTLDMIRKLKVSTQGSIDLHAASKRGNSGKRNSISIQKNKLAIQFVIAWKAHFSKLPPQYNESPAVIALEVLFELSLSDKAGAQKQLRKAIKSMPQKS